MSKNLLNSIQVKRPNRNFFDLSHDVKMSLNMGELVPCYIEDCIPGDKFNVGAQALVRFAPMVAPMMHMVNVYIHFFFVPKRIVWPNWENYITNTLVGGSLPAPPIVGYDTGGAYTRLMDYFGLPTPIAGGGTESVSAIPFAAYQKIFNEYYRDQNLVTEVVDTLVDGSNFGNQAALTTLRNRAWSHDYFTSCLPFAQKGNVVTMPMQADVTLKNNAPSNPMLVKNASAHATIQGALTSDGAGKFQSNNTDSVLDPNGNLEVVATSTPINDFRRALKLQEFLERDARGGTRYNEKIYAHFGVKSSDARLQRPEYITGVMSPVQVSEVLNTTGTSGQLPQGNMSGHGMSVVSSKGAGNYFCEEHGYIIGIMSVMPKTAYQQGIPKHFLKVGDWSEHFWTEFANIGEQAVLNKEIYAFQGSAGANTFGYIPRYAEYKFAPSRVCGDFKTSLNHWHMGRIFSAPPALNSAFITSDPTHRVFAVTDPTQQKLYVHCFNSIKATRLMPKYGTPML